MRLPVKIGLGVLAIFAALQAVRFGRTNPPVSADLEAPPDVKSVLRRACYDCHSNETTWPWYTQVAPFSWLAHYDVSEGREAVNFSEWGAQGPEQRAKKRRESAESVAEGEMPPWYYLPAHPEARLSEADKALIARWAASQQEKP